MQSIENFKYSKLTLENYYQKLKELLSNEKLQKLNISYSILDKTHYQYNIDCITIGNGDKELFLVAGTHGSEIITTDFIINFINELPNIEEFDPNKIKLIILPLQNPEGFDICTNTFKEIQNINFTQKSYEYYFKYKIDTLITNTLKDLHKLNLPNESNCLNAFINFLNQNKSWIYLTSLVPNINKFNKLINNLDTNYFNDYHSFLISIITTCNRLISNNNDELFNFFLLEIKNFFETNLDDKLYINTNKRLYQEMFNSTSFEGLKNSKLVLDTKKIYIENNHPKGSQINHDSTGLGINLNANNTLNPGLLSIKNNITVYGPGVKSNIKNYTKGPLGVPTLNINNFEYAKENLILEKLINNSKIRGKYLATLLYHGTGGLIYYKPHQELMNENDYENYLNFNLELANIYKNYTNYKILNESDSTGYGDYLRRTYPGVLLIELSKMGGNPLGPYGDKNNIYEVFNENTKALTSIIKHLTRRR